MEKMLPMTAEAIRITEKKMNMTLDDIIQMSKKSSFKARKSRPSRQGQGSQNTGSSQGKSSKVQWFLDSRNAIRQELLSQRRLNLKRQVEPPVAEYAGIAAAAATRNNAFTANKNKYQRRPRPTYGPFQTKAIEGGAARKVEAASELRPGQTLDLLFADMKAQRMRTISPWQMQQGQPLRARAIEGQRQGRGIRRVGRASLTNRAKWNWLRSLYGVFGANKADFPWQAFPFQEKRVDSRSC